MSAATKMKEKYEAKRNRIWSSIGTEDHRETRILWEQKRKTGFVNIPRAMPYILNAINSLAPKGKPVSSTYLALWCQDFGTAFIEIKDTEALAFEAGFNGSRATTTLNGRIKLLSNETAEGIGLIRTQKSRNGKYKSILMLNPLLILYLHYKKGTLRKDDYDALYNRNIDIGNKDLESIENGGEKYIEERTKFLNNL